VLASRLDAIAADVWVWSLSASSSRHGDARLRCAAILNLTEIPGLARLDDHYAQAKARILARARLGVLNRMDGP